eukprot:m.54304 g.54304  ORF g.54304 m.54304 type:complete len:254 (-) comp11407_c2_seq1:229-990(-)
MAEDMGSGLLAMGTSGSKFYQGFFGGFSMMIVSELGDKTFFIAAILAMRHSRLVIFSGAIAALALMTVLSAYVGSIASFIPKKYTTYGAILLFVIFGLRLLKEGYSMSDDEGLEELEEVTQELKAKEDELAAKEQAHERHIISPVLVQSFILTFLAEWGDRSQIATIILGAKEDPLAVSIGAVLGHSVCTAIAVIGGRLLAQRISVRTVTMIGGAVFLMFAITSALFEETSFETEFGFGGDVNEEHLPPVQVT